MLGMKSVMIALCSVCSLSMAYANGVGKNNANASAQEANNSRQLRTDFLYSYTDLKFDSTRGANFSRFQGHANQYGVGANRVIKNNDWLGGLFIFRVDTKLHSQSLIAPGAQTHLNQSIDNYTLLGNVTKLVNKKLSVSLAGAYGINRINNQLIIDPGTASEVTGNGVAHSYNWFTSLSAFYRQPWNSFILTTNLRVLYSEIDSKTYSYDFASAQPTLYVQPLLNRVTWIMENAELNYRMDDRFRPFINGGLIQVADNYNSRPLIGDTIVGSLPQLSINKSGYRVGGGLSISGKQWVVRLEQKYYNSKGTYSNNQTIVNLTYQIV